MKKLYILIIIICTFTFKSNAQNKVGIKAGTNFSYISGLYNVENKPRVGPMVGLFADLAASRHLHFQPEILLSTQGARYSGLFTDDQTNLHLSYINVPFLVKVYIPKIVSLYAGPQYGYLFFAKETIESSGSKRSRDINSFFQKHEFSMVYGIGFDIFKNFNFGARLNYGVSDIRLQPKTLIRYTELHNRGFQFNVGYAL